MSVPGSAYALSTSAATPMRAEVQEAEREARAQSPQTRQEYLRLVAEALASKGATDGTWFGLEGWALGDALSWVVEGQDGWNSVPILPPTLRAWSAASGVLCSANLVFGVFEVCRQMGLMRVLGIAQVRPQPRLPLALAGFIPLTRAP